MSSPHSLDPGMLSPDIRPGDDFFGYVNSKWIHANPIPPEESSWGSFSVLRREAELQIKEILEEIFKKAEHDLSSTEKKVRDFYASGMDVARLAEDRDTPLKELFEAIGTVRDKKELSALIGKFHRLGIGAFWSVGVEQDLKNSEVMALYFGQGGLGLPDRDYYLNQDDKSRAICDGYIRFAKETVGDIPMLSHFDGIPAEAFEIEKKLAAVSWTRVELRDVERQYNKMTPRELAALTPHINWEKYWASIGIKEPDYVIVCQTKFLEEVSRLFESLPLESIRQYLRWRVVNDLASFLGEAFDERIFDFYGRTFSGAKENQPRWRRVLRIVNGMLDEAIGELYVTRHFSEDAKAKISELVEHLTAAYRARIDALDWMSDDTKMKAIAKLDAVTKKLGYPDKWKDYSGLKTVADSYAVNFMGAHAFEFDRQAKKIGGPVDRLEWHMPPQMVNAYYNPPMNEIVFPAAILQPPFFDPAADLGANYGGIGSVIGHELTHGFDDQGSLFDRDGNLQNWWTQKDRERFESKTAKLVDQYDRYEPLPGLRVNGKLTLGENIADLGGVVIAYDALQRALGDETGVQRKSAGEPIDGLTPSQRFFINLAIGECGMKRDEALRLQIQTDSHSPSVFRVNGPLSNVQEFYDAFDVKEGDALWRREGDRIKIW